MKLTARKSEFLIWMGNYLSKPRRSRDEFIISPVKNEDFRSILYSCKSGFDGPQAFFVLFAPQKGQ
jgi:hypothetical protein